MNFFHSIFDYHNVSRWYKYKLLYQIKGSIEIINVNHNLQKKRTLGIISILLNN